MHSIITILKRLSLSVAVLTLGSFTMLGGAGLAAADCDPTPPPESSYGSGVHYPTGSAAVTYVYDCNTDTWSNAHYTYYPKTNTYVANYSANYSYNCDTGVWTMDEWDYSPGDGQYHLNRATTADPGLATNCPAPVSSAPTSGSDPAAGGSTSSGNGISNTGPGSSNSTNGTVTLNGSTTNNNNLGMNNVLVSNANTGNAFVISNTSGGSATSGTAQSVANVANLLQSTSNAFSPNTTMFTANINGDVTGDFMFDPSAIMNTGPGSTNSTNGSLTVNTNDTNNTNAQINNTLDVGATSGNATVSGNTTGGDATSGNAQAIVNLMNLINSTVAAGNSFIGTININGNLNGFNYQSNLYYKNGSFTTTVNTTALTANQTITLPNATGTVALTNDTANFIRNQATQQAGANFNIAGTGIANILQASTFDASAAGTLNIGSTNATSITFGNTASGNYITFSAAGGLTAFGTARHGKTIARTAEYAGAVLNASSDSSCSSASNGTMTSGYDFTNAMSYYDWTGLSSAQCYDVVVRVTLPSDFGGWSSNTPLTLKTYTNSTSTGLLNIDLRDTTNTSVAGCSYVSATPGSSATWATAGSGCNFSGGTYTAGGTITIRIRMTGSTGDDVRSGDLLLNYQSKF